MEVCTEKSMEEFQEERQELELWYGKHCDDCSRMGCKRANRTGVHRMDTRSMLHACKPNCELCIMSERFEQGAHLSGIVESSPHDVLLRSCCWQQEGAEQQQFLQALCWIAG